MVECSEAIPYLKMSGHNDRSNSPLSFEQLCQQEMQAGLAKIHRQLENERRKQSRKYLVGFWPIALGSLLACIAPILSDIVSPLGTMAMGLVFPFVVLSQRPELHLGSTMAADLPTVMLYGQFLIEAALAKIGCKGRITFAGIAGRMVCCHIMATTLLVLVSGAIG